MRACCCLNFLLLLLLLLLLSLFGVVVARSAGRGSCFHALNAPPPPSLLLNALWWHSSRVPYFCDELGFIYKTSFPLARVFVFTAVRTASFPFRFRLLRRWERSRLEYNRLVTKAAAIIKGLDKGRPELKIVRLVAEYSCRK